MGKNLNTIERSERIRIGKNVPDEQAINTVVINASNVSLDAPLSGLYVAPIRYDTSVLSNTLVYNTITKEIVDAGISADNQTLQDVTDYGNTTTNTLEFNNPTTAFVSASNVGIANVTPIHTLDIGSNLYVDDTGSNVLTVLGSVYLQDNLIVDGNLTVRGDSTLVHSENLTISDPIVALGTNNTSTDFIFDLGIIMNRPDSNVTIGFIENDEKLVLAYTESSPSGRYIVPDSSNSLNVHVYGNVTANAFFGDGTTLDGVALATDLESNVVRIQVLETDLASNTERIEVLETDLASNTERIQVLETDLASNTERIQVLETDTASNASRIEVLETDLASNTERIQVLETDTASNASRIQVLETDLASNTERIQVLETDTASNVVRIQVLETDLASNTERIQVLETDTASNASRIEVLETDLASNTGRIQVLETDLASNTERIQVLETDTASNASRIEVLETDLASNTGRIVSLESEITTKAPINNPVFTGIITGNGGLLSNVTLEQVTTYGNTTSNTLHFTNSNVSLVTEGWMGVGTLTPDKTLHVAGDILADTDVYAVRYYGDGGLLSNTATTPALQAVTLVGSTTDQVVQFTNVSTGFITTSNVVIGGNVTVAGNIFANSNIIIQEELVAEGNVYANKDLEVVGNVYVSTNVSVSEELTVSGNVYADKDLEVVGNVYVNGNVVAYKDLLVTGNAYVSEELTVTGNVYANKDLEVVGNLYTDGNVVAYKDLLVTGNTYATGNITISNQLVVTGNVYANKDFKLTGNAYVTGNVNVAKQLSVTGNAYVSGNVEITKSLIVSANTHLKGPNVFITNTMDFLNPKTAIVTDLNSNVEVKLNQLANVVIGTKALANEDMLVYDGSNWTNQLQNHTFLYAKANVALSKGEVVYATGAVGNDTFVVDKADARYSTKMPAIGVVYQDLAQNGQGLIVTFGRADSIPIPGAIEGETVYVSNTVPGGLSNVAPTGIYNGAPNLIQNVGLVVKPHASQGVVSVTGVGRTNAIPNANVITSTPAYVYTDGSAGRNTLNKIDPVNLLTKLQTLQQVVNTGNTVANAVTLRGVSITSGDGFHGDLVVAGNVTVDTNTFKVDAEANRVGILTASPGQTLDVRGAANVGVLTVTSGTVTDATHSTSKDTGVLIITNGGLGVEANIHSTNVFAASHIAVGTSATSNTLDIRGTANVGALVATSTHISDSTEATSTTSGALQVTGGVGIQKDLYARDGHFSTDVSVGSLSNKAIPYANASKILTDSLITQEDNGDIVISTDLQITGNLIVQGNTSIVSANSLVVTDRIIDIANNNPEHDLDIGILMEHPGHNIGIIHHATDELTIGYTSNGYGDSHVLRDYSNEFTVNVWGYVITQNTVTIVHNDLHVESGQIGVNTSDPDADIHVVGNVHVTSNISTASNVLITGDAAATSKTTGALQVTGGVGIQGDLYATHCNFEDVEADSVDITDTTAATNKTTGALKVAGGTGISGALYGAAATFDGVTSVTNSTAATGKTDGALVVTGGVGVSGALYGAAATFDGVTSVTNATAVTSKTDGALVVTGGVGVSGDIHATHCNFEDVEADSVDITDTTAATNKTSGALKVAGGVGVQGDIHATHCNFEDVEADSVTVTDATTSTSTTTGAIQVAGGVSTQENLNVGGVAKIWDSTDASSTSTGALQVLGGLGVTKSIHAADTTFESVVVTDTTQATSTTTGALTVAGGISTQTNVHAANVYISGGLITNTAGVTKKTYAYSGTIGNTEQPHINVCFTNESFSAKIDAQLIEGDDEISTLSVMCCGGNKAGTFPVSDIQSGSVHVFGPASTNPWSATVVTDKTTVALRPSAAIDTSGEYHIFVEYLSAKSGGAVANVVQDTTEKVVFGY